MCCAACVERRYMIALQIFLVELGWTRVTKAVVGFCFATEKTVIIEKYIRTYIEIVF